MQWKAGVPVEVAPFAYAKVLQNLVLLGSQNPKLRMGKAKAGPVVSDNGNFIIDAPFSTEDLKDPLRVSVFASGIVSGPTSFLRFSRRF